MDELCVRLRQIGLDAEANRIYNLLHKAAWTTSSELFRELQRALRNIMQSREWPKMPQELRDDLNNDLSILDDHLW